MFKFLLLFVVTLALASDTWLSDDEEFEKFKKDFNKVYATPEEEANRKAIFVDALKLIKEHNAKFEKGEVSYSLGINGLADSKPGEYTGRINLLRQSNTMNPKTAAA